MTHMYCSSFVVHMHRCTKTALIDSDAYTFVSVLRDIAEGGEEAMMRLLPQSRQTRKKTFKIKVRELKDIGGGMIHHASLFLSTCLPASFPLSVPSCLPASPSLSSSLWIRDQGEGMKVDQGMHVALWSPCIPTSHLPDYLPPSLTHSLSEPRQEVKGHKQINTHTHECILCSCAHTHQNTLARGQTLPNSRQILLPLSQCPSQSGGSEKERSFASYIVGMCSRFLDPHLKGYRYMDG